MRVDVKKAIITGLAAVSTTSEPLPTMNSEGIMDVVFNAKSANQNHGAITIRERCERVSEFAEKLGAEFEKSVKAYIAANCNNKLSIFRVRGSSI